MDFFDREMRQLVVGMAVGGATVVTAPHLVRVVVPVVRPLLKAVLTQGMLVSARGAEAFARLGESFEDVLAEARADADRELDGPKRRPPASGEGDGKRPRGKGARGQA